MSFFKVLSVLVYLTSTTSHASERITSQYQDLAKANQIYVGPGLVSVIEFPDAIVDVKIGSPDRIKTVISANEPRELTIYLSSSSQFPTNMLIRSQNKVYVYDVIPSLNKHQDFIKIKGTYGSPQLNQKVRAIESVSISLEVDMRKRPSGRVVGSEKLQ